MKSKRIGFVFLALFITFISLTPLASANYQAVIDEIIQYYPLYLQGDMEEVDHSTYLKEINIPGAQTSEGIAVGFYDIDQNGSREMLVKTLGDSGGLMMIYTLKDEQVYRIADDSNYIGYRKRIDFYQDGSMFHSISGGVATSGGSWLLMSPDGTSLVEGDSYIYHGDSQTYENSETGEQLSDHDFKVKYNILDKTPLDINQEIGWIPIVDNQGNALIEPSQVQSALASQDSDQATNQTDSQASDENNQAELGYSQTNQTPALTWMTEIPKGDLAWGKEVKSMEDYQSTYLTELRRLDQVWADLAHAHLDQKKNLDQIRTGDRLDFAKNKDFHPIIPALYSAFYQCLDQLDDSSAHELSQLLHDSFVLEKMLLPDLNETSHEALNQLRLQVIDTYYAYNDAKFQESGFMGYEWVRDQLDKKVVTLPELLALDDDNFDLLNRIGIASGYPGESTGFQLFPSQFDYGAGLPQSLDQYFYLVLTQSPGAQDIGGSQAYYLHLASGEMTSANLGSLPKLEAIEVPDYQARYGIEVTNYYPAYSAKETNNQGLREGLTQTAPAWTGQEDLANLMASWGQTMGQAYQAYTPDKPASFYGASLPQVSFKFHLYHQVIEGLYDQMPSKDNQMRVVAVYSDIKDTVNPNAERHLYLFVSDKNNGIRALIATQGPGEDGLLTFKDTANKDLINGFIEVANNH